MSTLEEHTFDHGDRTTFYLAAGPAKGPLLIFIHGWPAIGFNWKSQLTTFASLGFRVVAPDMPGKQLMSHEVVLRKLIDFCRVREVYSAAGDGRLCAAERQHGHGCIVGAFG